MFFEDVELTMSHTSLGNLNEFSLMVLFGNIHSHRLVSGLDIKPNQITSKDGKILYPAYFMTKLHVPIDNLLSNFKLWDQVKVGVDVVRYGETLLESSYVVGHADSLNVKSDRYNDLTKLYPTMRGSNLIVVEEMNGETGKRQVANPSETKISQLQRTKEAPIGLLESKHVRHMGADYFDIHPQFKNLQPISYKVSPRRDAMDGHAMIFAKYTEVMDVVECEFLATQLSPRISIGLLEKLEVLDREIYYYGNCFAGEELEINLAGEIELSMDEELVDELDFIPAGYLNLTFELYNKRTGSLMSVCKVKKVFAIPMRDQELISDLHRTMQNI